MEEKQVPTTRKLEDKSPIKYENQHPMTENSDLPEGFFDDPVQDAKVRSDILFLLSKTALLKKSLILYC